MTVSTALSSYRNQLHQDRYIPPVLRLSAYLTISPLMVIVVAVFATEIEQDHHPFCLGGLSLRIAIDLDSTLSNLESYWLQAYNADYGDLLAPDDLLSWETHLYVKPECGTNIYSYLNEATLYLRCEPREGSQEVLRGLLVDGHDLLIVSSCVKGAFDAKQEWLMRYFPEIPRPNFIACHRKELIRADVLIDDGFHNLEHFPGLRILIDAPWNRSEYQERGTTLSILHGKNWGDIKQILEAISSADEV